MLTAYYTLPQWLTFFYIYCFLGWCVESTIVSVSRHKLTNRGFLRGPILPIYGTGGIIVLASTLWIHNNLFLLYVFGMLSATILEYIVGALMETVFKMKYWDYSDKPFNLHGYICLKSSLFWGVLSIVFVDVLHRYIAAFVLQMDQMVQLYLLAGISAVAAVDAGVSFKRAVDFRKLMIYITTLRKQMSELSEKITESGANLKETITESGANLKEAITESGANLKETITESGANLKETITESGANLKETITESGASLKERLAESGSSLKENISGRAGTARTGLNSRLLEQQELLRTNLNAAKQKMEKFRSGMTGFPTASSRRFGDALEEFKDRFKGERK